MYQGDTLGFSRGAEGLWAAPESSPALQGPSPALQIVPREPTRPAHCGLVRGSSPAMQRVYEMIDRVAPTDASVLIVGESGSGKELVAQTIHQGSDRRRGTLRGGELRRHPGLAGGGRAVRLREGGVHRRRPHPPRLLRARGGRHAVPRRDHRDVAGRPGAAAAGAGKRRFWRVGGDTELRAEVRVVAATNRDLGSAVSRGPAARGPDVPPGGVPDQPCRPCAAAARTSSCWPATFWLCSTQEAGTGKTLSKRSVDVLRTHPWPGNVRELKNCVHRAFILADAEVELEHMLPAASARSRTTRAV